MRHPQPHPMGECQRRPRREPRPSYLPSNNRPQITTHPNPEASVGPHREQWLGTPFPPSQRSISRGLVRSQNTHWLSNYRERPSDISENQTGNLDLLPPSNGRAEVAHAPLRKPAKTENWSKIHNLIILNMSRFQSKITHCTKNQKDLNLNEKGNRCQHQDGKYFNYLMKILKQQS